MRGLRWLTVALIVADPAVQLHAQNPYPIGNPYHHAEVMSAEKAIIISLQKRNQLTKEAIRKAIKLLKYARNIENPNLEDLCKAAQEVGELLWMKREIDSWANRIPQQIGWLNTLDRWEEQYFLNNSKSYSSLQREWVGIKNNGGLQKDWDDLWQQVQDFINSRFPGGLPTSCPAQHRNPPQASGGPPHGLIGTDTDELDRKAATCLCYFSGGRPVYCKSHVLCVPGAIQYPGGGGETWTGTGSGLDNPGTPYVGENPD